MPTLTFEVPRSEWAKLEKYAEAEGVSVRALVLWKLKGEFGFPIKPRPEPEPQAA